MADFNLGRMKFVWQGEWVTATQYVKDDVVREDANSYICLEAHTAGTFSTDLAADKWELMIPGTTGSATTTDGDMVYNDSGTDVRLPIGTAGQALIVDDIGHPAWTNLATAQSIYYVKADGNDDSNGSNLNEAFKTIRHACDVVTGPATIYVKGGLYYERLPITVAPNVTIVGDGQRTTGVAPVNITNNSASINATTGAQTSTSIIIDDSADVGGTWTIGDTITISTITNGGSGISGTVTITDITAETPIAGTSTITVSFTSQTVTATDCTISSDHSEGTMWRLNDGATLNKMYFKDMQGFAPNLSTPEDITTATIAGIFVALDPDHPIINKSPYVIECSAFSDNGAIGAVVDGDLHTSGNKSMLFHAYTVVCSDGVGFWVNGQGKSEIVSCFTYFCWYGYITTGGGKIRALNGNNSYGTYGVVSRGFDADETPNTGAIYGNQLVYNPLTLVGEFSVGNTITGDTSGATGTITNVQSAVNKIYYINTNGFTFQAGETITASGGKSATIETGGVTGQLGFVIVADGFSEEPRPGGSVSITGDAFTYVIQSVSGTYVNSSSVLTLVFANEKPNASVDNTALEVRYGYSQSRLTGHDFLSIGTGDKISTNYPGEPLQASSQANEVIEAFPGRVFYVSTDQDGNFRVGDYFRVDQATGRATLNASAFDLSGLTSLRLGSIGAQLGELVSEFSSDSTLSGNSNEAVPTEAAVRGYFSQVATSIVPVDDLAQDLGSSTKRWRELYLGAGSIKLGSLTISDVEGRLAVTTETPGANAISTPTPVNPTDAANKAYVDEVAQGIIAKPSVRAATTTNLAANYSNGTDGVGATLTADSNRAFGTLDGVTSWAVTTPPMGVLVKNQTDPAHNGRYNLTTLGSGSTPWVLTKCGLCDEADEIPGAYVFVAEGTQAGTGWIQTVADPDTFVVGTDDILIVQFSGAGTFTAGTGLTLTGSAFSVNASQTQITSVGTLSDGLNIAASQTYKVDTAEVLSKSKLTLNGSSSGTVALQAAAAAGSITYTLPSADAVASGYALTSNGSGTLSWTNVVESTSVNKQVGSLGVGTAASGTTGEIRATNSITSFYSDDRLKTRLGKIENALDKICALEGFYYEANATAQALGYTVNREVGVSAQSTQKEMAEIVKPAPISDQYLTVQYEKFAPYIIEAIKELRAEIETLKGSK
jgi:hypothetical protein